MISGVCVGLSEFAHIDVTIIRILFVIFALLPFVTVMGWALSPRFSPRSPDDLARPR